MLKKNLIFFFQILCLNAHAAMGMLEIPASNNAGLVTLFYPTHAEEHTMKRGSFTLHLALDALPVKGNEVLVVISHGSPASPWVYLDLARTLVNAGFVVAIPEHYADNYKDASESGPQSWIRRPLEISRAIDVLARHPIFSPLLQFNRVGMYGMSAGGHTALSLAGGRWSPSRLRAHCEEHIAEDFQACVGLNSHLTGSMLDRLRISIARTIINQRFKDEQWYEHFDPRITAVVAGVPLAADFDPRSLATPKVKLGIISAQKDIWLLPKFHSEAILAACSTCEHLANLQNGSHGALLSPQPPGASGLLADLIADPPGFNRSQTVPEINNLIVTFFLNNLIPQK